MRFVDWAVPPPPPQACVWSHAAGKAHRRPLPLFLWYGCFGARGGALQRRLDRGTRTTCGRLATHHRARPDGWQTKQAPEVGDVGMRRPRATAQRAPTERWPLVAVVRLGRKRLASGSPSGRHARWWRWMWWVKCKPSSGSLLRAASRYRAEFSAIFLCGARRPRLSPGSQRTESASSTCPAWATSCLLF